VGLPRCNHRTYALAGTGGNQWSRNLSVSAPLDTLCVFQHRAEFDFQRGQFSFQTPRFA
jgi:hypothetical protein